MYDDATAHSGDVRSKPRWGPRMERRSGFKALREGRSHRQYLWVWQSQRVSEGWLLGELGQEAETKGVKREKGSLDTGSTVTGVPLGSFGQAAWLPWVTRMEECLWKALGLLSAALKAESSGTDFCVRKEAQKGQRLPPW